MSYQKINNLYKDQSVLMFNECYALEKIHGTSAHISWDASRDDKLMFYSGGEKHNRFIALFDQEALRAAARKPHKCCECGEAIHKGQRYQLISGLWDGEWDSYETCLPCAAIRSEHCPRGAIFGQLVANVFECLEFDYREAPE